MMYSQAPYTPTPFHTDQAAQRLRSRLLHYFNSVCPERHGFQIPVGSPEDTGRSDVDCLLRFDLPDPLAVEAHFRIDHVGGNVVEVSGGLEGRPVERFTCCLPEPLSDDALASLGETIGEFLLTEVKYVVGTHVLRHLERLEVIPA